MPYVAPKLTPAELAQWDADIYAWIDQASRLSAPAQVPAQSLGSGQRPRPRPSHKIDWRKVVDDAIAEGSEAEIKISARDLDSLLHLQPEKRQAIADKQVADRRLGNLLPEDLQRLRESLGGKGRKPTKAKVDAKVVAEARRQREIANVKAYIAGYTQALKKVGKYLKSPLGEDKAATIANHLANGKIKLAITLAGDLAEHLNFQRAVLLAKTLQAAHQELRALGGER